MGTRQPAVAGSFYPGDPGQLGGLVDGLFKAVPARDSPAPPKALIVPHAGYVYSGGVAASAYSLLSGFGVGIERVVLMGPSHRVQLRGLAASTADAFMTPLGPVPVDRSEVERALRLPQVQELDAAHESEHSLEVQLPFLQRVLGEFTLVPIVAGEASSEEVAEVLDEVWGGDETLIVVSSDLSHYLEYEAAREIDAETSRAIEELAPERIGPRAACGRVPVRGLLVAARRRGLSARTVDLASSGDTAGGRDEVVGYGAYAFA